MLTTHKYKINLFLLNICYVKGVNKGGEMNLNTYIEEIISLMKGINFEEIENNIEKLVDLMTENRKILICGNGGSAADSQHLATELVVKFEKERKPLKALALTTDTSLITATSNDYIFEKIFSRQVEALGEKGDILICFSTSGNSKNVIEAAKIGKKKGIIIVGFLGKDGGELIKYSDIVFLVKSNKTSHIQEIHQMLYHFLCKKIDEKL